MNTTETQKQSNDEESTGPGGAIQGGGGGVDAVGVGAHRIPGPGPGVQGDDSPGDEVVGGRFQNRSGSRCDADVAGGGLNGGARSVGWRSEIGGGGRRPHGLAATWGRRQMR